MSFTIDPRAVLSARQPTEISAETRKQEDLAKLRESARDFESIFINEMYKAMRKNTMSEDDSLIPKDNATKMFEEMRDMEMAKLTAEGEGIGIGEAIYRQMAPLIEKKVY